MKNKPTKQSRKSKKSEAQRMQDDIIDEPEVISRPWPRRRQPSLLSNICFLGAGVILTILLFPLIVLVSFALASMGDEINDRDYY